MFKFFVDIKNNDSFIIDSQNLRHMKAARVFDEEFICVYQEVFYLCKYENGVAKIMKELPDNNEYKNEVAIAMSIIDTKRFEWFIQKATELGVTKIIPMLTQNVTKKIPGSIDKKLERWNQISRSAAEQSFRNKAAIIEKPMNFNDVINLKYKHKFISYMKSNQINESYPTNVLFLIGPEGGFTDSEAKLALNNGFIPISLGRRILRAETAGLAVLSKILERS